MACRFFQDPSCSADDRTVLENDALKALIQYQHQTLAIIFAGLIYGFVVVRFFDLLSPLSNARKIGWDWTQSSLFALVLSMVLLSTFSIIQGIVYLGRKALLLVFQFDPLPKGLKMSDVLIGLGIPISLPVVVWGANAFMESYWLLCIVAI
ncbi:hypothetical protein GALMADRAFT_141247 [Galerina marginata CBS 339.88]|uniref:Uncharacterized protein n=1 Tax=Galerina marginata (strain CBS 339.88) TaxID=685588 RepID=A0A067SVL8_GALM3|nr:hypothetical protein GALMADRAFT_141247 [Galerina marginata CBS 339.88]